jgi:ubiquinone/menaquinone biosynthesis C-methylase UbiE
MKLKKLLRTSLSKKRSFDDDLVKGLSGPEYDLLKLPASQYTYQFMADFMTKVSAQHFVEKLNDLNVLDWGCGKAHISYLLSKQGFEKFTLAEVKGYRHTKLWDRVNGEHLVLTHPSKLDLPDNSVDMFIAAGVLEHVPHDLESLYEIQRVLKPNGLFFCFNLPSSSSPIQLYSGRVEKPYHDRLYGPGEVRELLKRSGLKPLLIYRRQLLPRKIFRYRNPEMVDLIDNIFAQTPLINRLATSIEFVAVNQNCHQQEG